MYTKCEKRHVYKTKALKFQLAQKKITIISYTFNTFRITSWKFNIFILDKLTISYANCIYYRKIEEPCLFNSKTTVKPRSSTLSPLFLEKKIVFYNLFDLKQAYACNSTIHLLSFLVDLLQSCNGKNKKYEHVHFTLKNDIQ